MDDYVVNVRFYNWHDERAGNGLERLLDAGIIHYYAEPEVGYGEWAVGMCVSAKNVRSASKRGIAIASACFAAEPFITSLDVTLGNQFDVDNTDLI